MRRIVLGFATLIFLACVPADAVIQEESGEMEGGTHMTVQGLSSRDVSKVTVRAQPANTTTDLTYDRSTGNFDGYLVLPPGEQELTAEAIQASDGATVVVGRGQAKVTVPAGGSASVSIGILDSTQGQHQGDIEPLITSLVASKTRVNPDEEVSLQASATDLDGDSISYAWTDNCGGTFSTPSAASTTWKKSASGACSITVTASSRGGSSTLSDKKSAAIQVIQSAEGSVGVSGAFVSRPEIVSVSVSYSSPDGGSHWSTLYRNQAGGKLVRNVPAGQNVWSSVHGNSIKTTALSDDCGGTVGEGMLAGSWRAPRTDAGIVCKLTARASNGTLEDTMVFGVEVVP